MQYNSENSSKIIKNFFKLKLIYLLFKFFPDINKINDNQNNPEQDIFINNNVVQNEELFLIKNHGLGATNFNSNPMNPLTGNNFYNNNALGLSNGFSVNGFSATNGFNSANNLKKFNNFVKGKLIKGSIAAKNKEIKESYRTTELLVL